MKPLTLFSTLGYDDTHLVREIGLVEQKCADFKLACTEIAGRMGIWLDLGVGHLFVRPSDLVSSICNDGESCFMDILSNGQYRESKVAIRRTDYCYEWSILSASLSLHVILHFKFADYVEKIRSAIENLRDAYDKDGKPIVMPELYEWRQEIDSIVVASETGKPYEKDWADYHRRGLEIAHKLRKVLSSDFDLWYEPPYEDKSRKISQKILIL